MEKFKLTEEEKAFVLQLQKENGNNWSFIYRNLVSRNPLLSDIPDRKIIETIKSLRPKHTWTHEDDLMLVRAVYNAGGLGNTKFIEKITPIFDGVISRDDLIKRYKFLRQNPHILNDDRTCLSLTEGRDGRQSIPGLGGISSRIFDDDGSILQPDGSILQPDGTIIPFQQPIQLQPNRPRRQLPSIVNLLGIDMYNSLLRELNEELNAVFGIEENSRGVNK